MVAPQNASDHGQCTLTSTHSTTAGITEPHHADTCIPELVAAVVASLQFMRIPWLIRCAALHHGKASRQHRSIKFHIHLSILRVGLRRQSGNEFLHHSSYPPRRMLDGQTCCKGAMVRIWWCGWLNAGPDTIMHNVRCLGRMHVLLVAWYLGDYNWKVTKTTTKIQQIFVD